MRKICRITNPKKGVLKITWAYSLDRFDLYVQLFYPRSMWKYSEVVTVWSWYFFGFYPQITLTKREGMELPKDVIDWSEVGFIKGGGPYLSGDKVNLK